MKGAKVPINLAVTAHIPIQKLLTVVGKTSLPYAKMLVKTPKNLIS